MSKLLCCCLTGQNIWICPHVASVQILGLISKLMCGDRGNLSRLETVGQVRSEFIQTLELISFLLLLNKESGLFLRKPRISFHFSFRPPVSDACLQQQPVLSQGSSRDCPGGHVAVPEAAGRRQDEHRKSVNSVSQAWGVWAWTVQQSGGVDVADCSGLHIQKTGRETSGTRRRRQKLRRRNVHGSPASFSRETVLLQRTPGDG